jgi:hypothetical protein
LRLKNKHQKLFFLYFMTFWRRNFLKDLFSNIYS